MKYLLAVAFAILTTLAPAQQINQGPAGPTLANAATALVAGWLVSFGALVTGNVPELCARLNGTYTTTGIDRCPDGQWRYLVSSKESRDAK